MTADCPRSVIVHPVGGISLHLADDVEEHYCVASAAWQSLASRVQFGCLCWGLKSKEAAGVASYDE